MSHWMTSGKSRLRAKQDRSFSRRAKANAALLGYTTSRSKKRNDGEPKNIQYCHPRFHKRTAVQDLGSTWDCPIARRGIVAAGKPPRTQHQVAEDSGPTNKQCKQRINGGTYQIRKMRNGNAPAFDYVHPRFTEKQYRRNTSQHQLRPLQQNSTAPEHQEDPRLDKYHSQSSFIQSTANQYHPIFNQEDTFDDSSHTEDELVEYGHIDFDSTSFGFSDNERLYDPDQCLHGSSIASVEEHISPILGSEFQHPLHTMQYANCHVQQSGGAYGFIRGPYIHRASDDEGMNTSDGYPSSRDYQEDTTQARNRPRSYGICQQWLNPREIYNPGARDSRLPFSEDYSWPKNKKCSSPSRLTPTTEPLHQHYPSQPVSNSEYGELRMQPRRGIFPRRKTDNLDLVKNFDDAFFDEQEVGYTDSQNSLPAHINHHDDYEQIEDDNDLYTEFESKQTQPVKRSGVYQLQRHLNTQDHCTDNAYHEEHNDQALFIVQDPIRAKQGFNCVAQSGRMDITFGTDTNLVSTSSVHKEPQNLRCFINKAEVDFDGRPVASPLLETAM